MMPPRCANSPTPLTSTRGLVAAARPARSSRVRWSIRSPTSNATRSAPAAPAVRVRCTSARSGATRRALRGRDRQQAEHAQSLGRLVVLGQRALERQGGTLGQDPHAGRSAARRPGRRPGDGPPPRCGPRPPSAPSGRLARRAARCAARAAAGTRARRRRQVARQLGGQRRDATISRRHDGDAAGRHAQRVGGGHASALRPGRGR